MAKLSKPQIKAHKEACELLKKDALSLDEREFIINNWQESATHLNSDAGAFFTPLELAWTFAVEVNCGPPWSVIDLCAGIGCLSYAIFHRSTYGERMPRIVCVEKNPDYVAIGRKVLPEAEWICADVFELPDLGRFTFAISNPPFGKGGPTKGLTLDLDVVRVASTLAEFGAFILPAGSVPFRYSGRPYYETWENAAYQRFHKLTGVSLEASCGIDCSYFRDQWRFASPSVEVATSEFATPRADAPALQVAAEPAPRNVAAKPMAPTEQLDLFGEAA